MPPDSVDIYSHKMKADRIFETILYSEDLEESEKFYSVILGLEVLERSEISVVFRLSQSVLLIFNPLFSNRPGRGLPSHGAPPNGHLAFTATQDEIEQWKRHLESKGVEIEKEVKWDEGGTSIYFRDPSGNSLEFAPPTLWGGNWIF